MHPNAAPPRRQGGFSLVEVTLALGVMAFCIIPVFGLLPVGINTNRATVSQTRAAGVATNICADVRGTSFAATATPRFNIDLSQSRSSTLYFSATGDAFTTTPGASSLYKAVVTITPGTSPTATWLNIVVSWPATASVPSGTYQSATAVNRY